MKKISLKHLTYIALTVIILGLPAFAGRYKASDVMMMATVIWHEAGGEGYKEMQKVANVIMNRFERFEGHGQNGYQLELGDILTYRGVFQGSAAYLNSRMTNNDILRYVIDARTGRSQVNSQSWKNALQLAQTALSGQLEDITHGATHFQACDPNKNGGFWADMKAAGKGAYAIKGVSTKNHCFYRGISDGAMKVNGHWIYQGKVTGRFSKGGGGVIPVHQGGGSGEGVGAKAQKSLSGSYGALYRNAGIIPGQASGQAGTGGAEYGEFVSVSGSGGDGSGGGGFSGYDNGSFDFTLGDEEYEQMCEAAKTETDGSTTPPNLFNTQILTRMTQMMEKIYISLGQVYALGQGLMCFATDVAQLKFLSFKFVNVPYWLTGLFIYLCAFFITMAIGMFFIDISFKIGFALLMLPISIALWPFEPTKGKLSENFSIIIRNSMLFALVSVGIGYAIILLANGVTHGIDDAAYYNAFYDSYSAKDVAVAFAMSGVNVLIIVFCLIYGFKIIQSSVNDYLNRLFPDNVFGGQSSMHTLGVQAVGTTAMHTILPAASLTYDIAKNQTGRGIEALGRGMQNIGKSPSAPTPMPVTGGGSGPTGPIQPTGYQADENPIEPETAESSTENILPTTETPVAENNGAKPIYNRRNQGRTPQKTLADRIKENQQSRRGNGQPVETPQQMASRQTNPTSQPENAQDFNAGAEQTTHTSTVPNSGGLSAAIQAGMALGQQDEVRNYSLSPGSLLKNTANTTLNILTAPLNAKTYKQLMQLPQIMEKRNQNAAMRQNQRDAQENAAMPNATNGQKIVMRLSRDATLFVRTAKQTVKNTGVETLNSTGSLLEKFGSKIRPTKDSTNVFDYLRQQMKNGYSTEAQKELEEEEKNQRITDETLSSDYVDHGNG